MISSVTNSALFGATASTTTPKKNLDKDAFMTLLITQLKNQDPMNPSDSSQLAAQLAQFTSVEQLTQLNDAVTSQELSLREATLLSKTSLSAALIGRRVVAAPYVPCGACHFCLHRQPTLCQHLFDQGLDPGGLAERVRIPRPMAERGLFPVPEALPSDIAALAEPAACCVQAAEACGISAGDTVLVVGDGPMGLMNAAVARAYGALQIIIAGLTPSRLELAAAHYADVVVNVEHKDLAQKVRSLTDGRGADVVLVAVPTAEAALSGLSALRRGGAFNAFAGTAEGTTIPLDLRRLHYDEWRITGSFGAAPQHLQRSLDLLSSGQIDVGPLITGRFPFAEAPAAVEHMARQVGMKAVVMFESDPASPVKSTGRSTESAGRSSRQG